MVRSMSAKAEAILEQFEGLPPEEQRALCRELERRLAVKPVGELYGHPPHHGVARLAV
jgi:serine/threonine protein kinase HipA of HipAB toxin-antitoxin module